MKVSRQIREQIDACRPGSDDLSLPELAELAAAVEQDRASAAELARSQRFDQAVSVAMHELPVPGGLMERILAAAEANKPSLAPTAETARRGWTRRRWVTIFAGSLAAALVLAVTAWQFVPGRPRQFSQEELSLAVAQWTAPGAIPAAAWVAKKPVPVAIPAAITVPTPALCQRVSVPAGWRASAVAINLTPPGGPRATLIVVSSKMTFNVGAVPTPLPLSQLAGKFEAVAWQSSTTKALYVLIVEKDRGQTWRDFLRPTRDA